MKYLQKSFSVAMPSHIKQEEWDKIFGKKQKNEKKEGKENE